MAGLSNNFRQQNTLSCAVVIDNRKIVIKFARYDDRSQHPFRAGRAARHLSVVESGLLDLLHRACPLRTAVAVRSEDARPHGAFPRVPSLCGARLLGSDL